MLRILVIYGNFNKKRKELLQMPNKEWVTCEEIASEENISVRAIQDRCKKGLLPCKKDGKKWLIDRVAYEQQTGKRLIAPDKPIPRITDQNLKSVLVFASAKGGVGKTTLSVVVADKLSILGYQTLLIDMDPQGNATNFSGLIPYKGTNRPGRNEYKEALHDVILGKISQLFNQKENVNIKDAIYPARKFFILPSDHRSERLKYWLTDNSRIFGSGKDIHKLWTEQFPFLLSQALKDVENEYDFIIIDTPPEMGWATENALMAGTDVVVPIELGRFEIIGLDQVYNFISTCSRKNTSLNFLGSVISRFGPHRSRLDSDLEEQIRQDELWGNYIFDTIIMRTLLIREATLSTESVFDYWRKGLSRASLESIEDFTEELLIRLYRRMDEEVAITNE